MVLEKAYLLLEGLEAGIALKVDASFLNALPLIFSHWPYEIVTHTQRDVFATAALEDSGRYRLASPFIDTSKTYSDALNALCAIVAELAWQRLREDPSLLCIHGAGAEFSGRLVVFPAMRKAGKSTLSVAMAATGIRIFSDDFLPISVENDSIIRGISSGVSPRLRLPLPNQFGESATQYLARRQVLSNSQYTYVKPLKTEQAPFGEALPIGGFVFLERVVGSTAELTNISTADALKTLIYQNFSRAGNAGDILAMLEFVVLNRPCHKLIYDDTAPAVALLTAHFSGWNAPLSPYSPRAVLDNLSAHSDTRFTRVTNYKTGQFEQAAGVKAVSADGQQFLTGRNGQSIHYLNEAAALIWQMLSTPTSMQEAIDKLFTIFPDQPRTNIERDVKDCFKGFGKNGLLQPVQHPTRQSRPSA